MTDFKLVLKASSSCLPRLVSVLSHLYQSVVCTLKLWFKLNCTLIIIVNNRSVLFETANPDICISSGGSKKTDLDRNTDSRRKDNSVKVEAQNIGLISCTAVQAKIVLY